MYTIIKSVWIHEYIYFRYLKYICIQAVNYYSKRILHFANELSITSLCSSISHIVNLQQDAGLQMSTLMNILMIQYSDFLWSPMAPHLKKNPPKCPLVISNTSQRKFGGIAHINSLMSALVVPQYLTYLACP